jgi:hypothetical protein
MNKRIFEAFETREKQVSQYMAGCGQKYGMPCTCGPDCRCANCSEHCRKNRAEATEAGLQRSTINNDVDMQEHGKDDVDIYDPGMGVITPGGANEFSGMHAPPDKDLVFLRNPSIISFGGNMRQMSITSETTFGRAMSGLSALSIDWENMDDFDINVDHSAHINSDGVVPISSIGGGGRRSSLRKSYTASAAAVAASLNCEGDCAPATQYNSRFKNR